MAAGLGFKDFTTGEVLTAADVDGYLMQGVWVFASAAARDAAVTSPQEGNFAYLKDTNVTTYYTGSAWANLDTTGMTNPMTTTGDVIYSSSGSTPARLGLGTAGQVLQVNSGATAPEWAAPAGGSSGPAFRAYRATSSQSIATSTFTKVQFQTEDFDTDNCYDPTTNYRFTPNKAGYYLLQNNIGFDNSSGASRNIVEFTFNGSSNLRSIDGVQGSAGAVVNGSVLKYFNGTSDYMEVFVLSNDATAAVFFGQDRVVFSGVWIRS